jgi:hypothetical protein
VLISARQKARPRSIGLTTVETGEEIVRQIELRKLEFHAQKLRVSAASRCAASATPDAVD